MSTSPIAAGLLVAALVHGPALATPEADAACPQAPPTSLQQRLIDKSDQGVEALRQFVFNTRTIYQLDIREVADWVTAQRAAVRHCMETKAAAEATAQAGG